MSQQDYAFSLFQEEVGEALQSIGKAGRFGLDTPGVKDPYTGAVDMSITPRTSLQKELGDVAAAIDFISLCGIVDKDAVNKRRFEKLSKLLDPSALDNLGNKLAPVPKYVAELEDRISSLEAEKEARERQAPVTWVLFDDIFIAPKDMQDDPPNLECMKPLYAHPLALREPTEDECREIWRAIRRTTAADQITGGRAMFNAVREVMTK